MLPADKDFHRRRHEISVLPARSSDELAPLQLPCLVLCCRVCLCWWRIGPYRHALLGLPAMRGHWLPQSPYALIEGGVKQRELPAQ